MVKANKGHVVEVASMSSFVSVGRFSDYSAGKAALVSFSESESAARNEACSSLSAGFFLLTTP
jgi:short-subunit dehydrogenase